MGTNRNDNVQYVLVGSGARTNLKIGATCPAKVAGNFFCHGPPLFWLHMYNSRFGERFRDGQYSLVSLLFAVLLLTVPSPVPSHL